MSILGAHSFGWFRHVAHLAFNYIHIVDVSGGSGFSGKGVYMYKGVVFDWLIFSIFS